ncbi:DUF1059 domain-containing protein [Halosolutus gelatinilyticus]|uniref:DUF1059 domain-containing protein n=1 Tax=Halosolutus gelatinilyticus TaxID=2931975 RepID=UPI001FF5B4D0|nr:DUF1059 domain-containing protein [Halosolutus gelatinilyticus]
MAYQFQCPQRECQFLIRSSSSEELERLVRAHARVSHRGRFDRADIDRRTTRIEVV